MRILTIATIIGFALTSQTGQTTAVTASDHFEFHSDPWINLHHFLYQWSREELGLGTVANKMPMPERSSVAKLSPQERDVWLKAVGFYRESVAARWWLSLEMLQLKFRLISLAGDPSAMPPDAFKGIAAALSGAMPIYLKTWWPEHDRVNRAWIAALLPRLRRHEARYVELTKRLYDATWSDSPYRVDVSAYPYSRAGYSTSEGTIVMYSMDPGNQDLYSLEMLLHEVQHVERISDQAIAPRAIRDAFERAGAKLPDSLSHALVFATAGEFTRSVAASEQLPEHIPYWLKQGLDKQDEWKNVVPVVQRYWLPVVRGETSREEGIAALARAFRAP